jgi:hypothetical protein
MLLIEELALVALDPESGRLTIGTRSAVNACLAGLLVADLVVAGCATTADKKVVLTESAPGSGPLAAAARVVAGQGPRIKAVLSAMDGGLEKALGTGTWGTAVAGLVAAGILGPAEGRLRPRHAVLDPAVREGVLARLQAAARGEGGDDLRTAALLSMTGPAHLLEAIVPRRGDRREGRRRIDHALDGTTLAPVGKAVRAVIRDSESVAAGAATGAVVAGS